MKQFATYFQDDWRVSDRLTLNFGVRYDLMTGYQFDESKNPNFVAVQAAGAAGLLKGIVGLENFGLDAAGRPQQHPAAHRRACSTSAATARTSSAAAGASTRTSATPTRTCCSRRPTRPARASARRSTSNVTNGIRNPDGSFYKAGQPLSNIASQNQVVSTGAFPLFGQWVDPRLQRRIRCRATPAGRTS